MDDLRLSGFIHQVQESGLHFCEERIITGCSSPEEVEAEIIKKIKDGMLVDGIFGRNDMLACIALNAIRKVELHVPRDIAVIGFDNSSISQLCNPALTTMEMQRESISRVTIEMLHSMVEKEEVELIALFKTNLIQ